MSPKAKTARQKKTVKKIDSMASRIVQDVGRGKNPFLDIPIRALSNVKFDPKKSIIELGDQKQKRFFFNVAMAKKFMQTMMVADRCKDHVTIDKTTSLRDMYYMVKHTMAGSNEETVDDQKETDECIEDLEVTLDELRESLGLFAMTKGQLVGEMTIVDSGDTIDLRRLGSGGWGVPSIVEPDTIRFKKCTAKFILLAEKDAVWRRLNEDKFWKKHRCLLIHGGGMPPRGVRRLVNRMASELKLPLYVLADNDPWGYYIYSVVKQGSINLAFESSRMAVPKARFLGLMTSDVDGYKIPKDVRITLNRQDINRCKQLLNYPWFQKKAWQKEIKAMLKSQQKLELEALSGRGITFISDKYLPSKLKSKDWLD